MDSLHEIELKLFVDSVRRYFQVVTKQEPQITSAFLATGDVEGYDFNGIVTLQPRQAGSPCRCSRKAGSSTRVTRLAR